MNFVIADRSAVSPMDINYAASHEVNPPTSYGSEMLTVKRVVVFLLLAAFYGSIPNARPDFSKFNCHSSESYLSLSYGLANGLGYTRSMTPDAYVPHTTWPPGMPVLMLPAWLISGKTINWVAAKLTIALIGLIGVILAWQLGRRWSGKTFGGDAAALALGLNPFYWDFSHQVMAEVPLTVWILFSLLMIDAVWHDRMPSFKGSLIVGVISGMGMLLKGHSIALIVAPLTYLIAHRSTATFAWRRWFATYALFIIGFGLPTAIWNVRNAPIRAEGVDGINQIRMIRAKDPEDPNSPLFTLGESIAMIASNIRASVIYNIPSQLVPFLWNESAYKWKGSGIVFLAVSALLLLLVTPIGNLNVCSLHLVLPPIMLLNLQYAQGGAPRFWVPVTSLMAILLSLRFTQCRERCSPGCRFWSGAALGILLLSNLLMYVARHERHPYMNGSWAEKADLFERSRDLDIRPIGVYTSNNHAFQIITGFPAPMVDELPVDYVVVDSRIIQPAVAAQLTEVCQVAPWKLCSLPTAMKLGAAKEFVNQ